MIKLIIVSVILYFAFINFDEIRESLSISTTNKVEGAFNDMSEKSGTLPVADVVHKDPWMEAEMKLLAEERKRVMRERTRIAMEKFKNGTK